MLLADVVDTSTEVGAVPARLKKIARLAELLGHARQDELSVIVAWLSGELPQRQIGVGWAALRTLPEPASDPSLTVLEVDARLSARGATSGPGSQAVRAELLETLFASATHGEQGFLRGLLSGELRQGAQRGVMADAVARAFGVPLPAVRRAAMLGGELPTVAVAAMLGGEDALSAFRLEVGRPVGPMLAQSATSVAEALAKVGGTAAIDAKLDGMRLQIHRHGEDIHLYTRTLDDVTARMPEIVEAVAALPVESLVADGEAIALREDGSPEHFQVTASRLGRRSGTERVPLRAFVFDVLHLDGVDLLDLPTEQRLAALETCSCPRRCRFRASSPPTPMRPKRLQPRGAQPWPRGSDGEVADRPLRGGAAWCGVGKSKARPHSRSGRPGNRMGFRKTQGLALQHPPRRTRLADR